MAFHSCCEKLLRTMMIAFHVELVRTIPNPMDRVFTKIRVRGHCCQLTGLDVVQVPDNTLKLLRLTVARLHYKSAWTPAVPLIIFGPNLMAFLSTEILASIKECIKISVLVQSYFVQSISLVRPGVRKECTGWPAYSESQICWTKGFFFAFHWTGKYILIFFYLVVAFQSCPSMIWET